MARVVALIDDLLFGSNVAGALRAAGHEVALVGSPERAARVAGGCELLIVDLAGGAIDPAGALDAVPGTRAGVPSLASYAHVHPEARAAALHAGFRRVVPRSKLARDAPALAAELLAAAQ